MNTAAPTPDFSLVLGGPLYQLWRGTRLAGDTLQLLHRRVIAMVLLAWVPLLLLSIAEGHAWGDRVRLPFLHDVELHVRLLIALPLLIAGRTDRAPAHAPGRRAVSRPRPDPGRGAAAFDAAIASAHAPAQLGGGGGPADRVRLHRRRRIHLAHAGRARRARAGTAWRRTGDWQPSAAGWWLGVVSLPLFQFLLLRWYFRLFIWARFLWQVSRLDLTIQPTHPDRAAASGFLGAVAYAFAPVLLAQGALLAGMIANQIFYAGATLPQFKIELIGLVAVMVFAVLGPLLVFAPQLAAAKRAGLREYGTLAQRYVREFDDKWLRGGAPADEPFVGSADIQSLADLGNSFDVVRGMRLVPFTMQTVLQLAVTTLAARWCR